MGRAARGPPFLLPVTVLLRYLVVSVFVVSVFVAVPIGVSTRDVEVDFEVSVDELSAGLFASMFTLVDEDGAGEDGWTIVVEELGAVLSRTTVSFFSTVVGSFTTVVEEVVAGRSQAASRPAERAITGIRASFIVVSVPWIWVAVRQRLE